MAYGSNPLFCILIEDDGMHVLQLGKISRYFPQVIIIFFHRLIATLVVWFFETDVSRDHG